MRLTHRPSLLSSSSGVDPKSRDLGVELGERREVCLGSVSGVLWFFVSVGCGGFFFFFR